MWSKIDIVVCHLTGSSQKAMEFQRKLKTYWKHHGDRQQGKDMLGIYSDSPSNPPNISGMRYHLGNCSYYVDF